MSKELAMSYYDNEPRHRKKHSQKSKAAKRADHKHEYEKVIIKTIFGYCWGGRCRICGRINEGNGYHSKEFIRPECRNKFAIGQRDFYTEQELQQLYHGVTIVSRSYF